MTWKEVEHIFNRALKFTFSRKKLLFTVPILIFCGLITVCFRALGAKTGDWLSISMTFLPIFLSSAVLLAAGIILTRIYHHEVKGLPVSYRKTLGISKDLMVEVAYLSVPMVLVYLVLWTLLGIFYLLKEIPMIGEILGIILSFGPFLLLLGSFALSLLSLAILFFVTPSVAFKSSVQFEVLQGVLRRLQFSPFSNLALMVLGLVPLVLVTGMMTLAAIVTGKSYVAAEHPIAIGMEWFFIMLPFSALLTPAVIFFFNFAAEAHVLMIKKQKESPCESPS
ncbi:MAG: hypothetical protein JSS60_02440 [Verrucomicrobia bacterium]|nr:hypothetical protein [Verrucomicrobiota bacterium]